MSKWREELLEKVMEAIIDYRGKSPEKTSSGVPLVTAKIVKDGRIDDYNEFIAEEEYEAWMRRGLPEVGDVLITTEAPLGEVAQVKDAKIALAQRIILLRGKRGVLDNTFFKYQCISSEFQSLLSGRSSGTTVTGIKQSELRKVPVSLPPLPIQCQIAAILSAFDDKIELNRQMNRTLEQLARALFKSWFVDFEPVRAKLRGEQPEGMDAQTAALFPDELVEVDGREVPKGWEWGTVGDIAFINREVLKRSDDLKKISYIEISAVLKGEISEITEYERGDEPSRARRRLRHGDTVLSTVRPDRQAYFLSIEPAENLIASTGFAVLSPREEVFWPLVFSGVTQTEVFELLGQAADGGAYPAVNAEIIGNLEICLTKEDQIAQVFFEISAPLLTQSDQLRRESTQLALLRDTLLPRLLSGELDVSEWAEGEAAG